MKKSSESVTCNILHDRRLKLKTSRVNSGDIIKKLETCRDVFTLLGIPIL